MRQCNEFMKLGLQGHSILFAAGDFGVASSPGDVTVSGCLGPDQNVFTPQYPSNCPYVTSVGGTMLTSDQTVNDPESVLRINLGGDAVNFSSAGGFSNYFPRPSYQDSAVAKFFEIANPPYPFYSEFSPDFTTTTGLYNRIGRAYPDVAANGANLQIFLDSSEIMIFGTSLAAPIFASVLTLVCSTRILR
jgi:tripeptidyl-peptidase-1